MYFIGDVHGRFTEYHLITQNLPESIQLGDMGIGFKKFVPPDENHRFIRGNHDNPQACERVLNFLGNFGYLEDSEIFFVSGGWSIDRAYRIEGRDWWPEEELDYGQFSKAIELYRKIKPRIMVTHGCPFDVYDLILDSKKHKCRTSSALSAMFQEHQPEAWIFAHFHQSKEFEFKGTAFCVLDELEVFEYH